MAGLEHKIQPEGPRIWSCRLGYKLQSMVGLENELQTQVYDPVFPASPCLGYVSRINGLVRIPMTSLEYEYVFSVSPQLGYTTKSMAGLVY